MSKFDDFIKEERTKLKSRTFSKDTFYDVLVNYLNEPEYTTKTVKKKSDQAILVADQPVKKFRKVLKNVLIDFGVAKDDAETVVTSYKFDKKTVDGMYEFITEFLYAYLKTGKKLKLFSKEDVDTSLEMIDKKAEKDKERKFKGELVGYEDIEDHVIVKSSAKAPDWKRVKKDMDKKVIKVIKLVDEEA